MDTGKLELAAQRHLDAQAAADAALADLRVEAVSVLQNHGEPGAHAEVARITGWTEEQVHHLMSAAVQEDVIAP